MAEKWTNTSSPSGWEMKPKPFASLNHFTVPLATWNSCCIRVREPVHAASHAAAAFGHCYRGLDRDVASTKNRQKVSGGMNAVGNIHRRPKTQVLSARSSEK